MTGHSRRAFLRRSSIALAALAMGAGGVALSACDPADLLAADALGLKLAPFFTARVVATTGDVIASTSYEWHQWRDGAACFPLPESGPLVLS